MSEITEQVLREAIREAFKTASPKEEKNEETFAPKDKEHLVDNKVRLNEELNKKWGYVKKAKKGLV